MMVLQTFLCSLVLVLTLYQATNASWRRVSDAELTNVPDGYTETYSDITTLDDCNSTCRSGSTGITCKSFVFSDNSGCVIYATRMGFDGAFLQPSTSSGSSDYYDRPTDEVDTLGDQIEARLESVGTTSFLAWFREGVSGRVSIDDTSTSDLELLVEITDISLEECAKLCLRRRGVIDETVGTRCDSFNYRSTGDCELLSISWDEDHTLSSLDSNQYDYYDRLQGDGCWVTQEGCRGSPDMTGVFTVTTDERGAEISWEYQCMAQAKEYHENVCDGYASIATSVFWGGTDGRGVYDSWNSWDFTTGCVIDLGGSCTPNFRNDSRFSGKFRDSIGEEQFNAGNSVDACFDRARVWQEYCDLPASRSINVSYPSSGATFSYPLINCTCDQHGMKVDPFSELKFCTRNESQQECWRNNQRDFWTHPDILCVDLPEGECPEFEESEWQNSSSYCWLDDFACVTTPQGSEYSYLDGTEVTFEVPCDADSGLYVPFGDCASFTEEMCANATQHYHELCNNDVDDPIEQAVAFYLPNGTMYMYPAYEDPAEETLIDGLDAELAYTKSNTSDYGMVTVGTGRWMSIYSGTGYNTYNIRQISIWFESTQTVSLTMSLYKGRGITGSVKLEDVSIGEFGPTEVGGEYIHFDIDNIAMESDTTYTWQVTSTTGENNAGFIGFGLDYLNGEGDVNWDYAFVIWVEHLNTANGAMQLFASIDSEEGPWFEVFFIIFLVLFGLWLIVLIGCHLKRKHDRKVEKRQERERQQEIKLRARQKALARNEEDADFYDDDEKGNKAGLVESDESDVDDDDDDVVKGLTPGGPNKHAIIEEEPDDDDAGNAAAGAAGAGDGDAPTGQNKNKPAKV